VVSVRELGELAEKASPNGRYIVLLQMAEGDEDIPGEAAGIVLGHALPHLSHLGVRARRQSTVFVACEDLDTFAGLKRLEGKNAELAATPDSVRLEAAAPSRPAAPAGQETVEAPEADLSAGRRLLSIDEAALSNAGSKAYSMRRLSELSASLKEGAAEFHCPFSLVIPFGVLQASIGADRETEKEYFFLRDLLKGISPENLAGTLQSLRALTGQLKVPAEISEGIREQFPSGARLMVRSSSNCEDLPNFSGAGLYDSVANVAPEEVEDAVRKVWASLWTERAFLGRRRAGIPHDSAHMAVLVQEMLAPEVSFFVHTVNPISRDEDEIYIELAVGLGETLATGIAKGTPYRFACGKSSGKTRAVSFASMETALFPDAEGGIATVTVDYSKIPLTTDPEARKRLIGRLAAVAARVEKELGGPQDIEGAVSDNKVYLFQSRPEQGVEGNVRK
jgi:phosphoglucan,water dikinase